MRVVIQRVLETQVLINGIEYSRINAGMFILLGVHTLDDQDDINWLVNKIYNLRIFSDHDKKMNLDLKQTKSEVMVVSQFTLFASTKKGNRPSFTESADPQKAINLYDSFCHNLSEILGEKVKTGIFGADMQIQLVNDGPVTIIIDSKNKE